MFSFDTNLDDGGADMTGTKGAESGLVGDVDAEEEAVDNEFEGLGRRRSNDLENQADQKRISNLGICTFTPLLLVPTVTVVVVEKPCIDAEVFSRRRLKQSNHCNYCDCL